MFWVVKKRNKPTDIHAMAMLKDNNLFSIDKVLSDFERNYKHKLKERTGDSTATTFRIDGELFGIVHVKAPIPSDDIKWAAEVAYNWPTAIDDLKDHQGHIIITTFTGNLNQVARFIILTELVFSLLRTSSAIGVYKGNQRLLIPKDEYLRGEMILRNNALPIYLWVYFGLSANNELICGHTFGLKEFGKLEIEIINSEKSVEQVKNLLYDISYYVIAKDISLRDGDTFGDSYQDKKLITKSKGNLLDGNTFKLHF